MIRPDFNPRSREGSDHDRNRSVDSSVISIHAPARGATCVLALLLDNFRQFQSTLPRGERLSLRFSRLVAILISIHAPARGATRPLFVLGHIWFISIHAPARGATVRHVSVYFDIQFQSTLPRGERRISSVLIMSTIYFNPRSREGSDAAKPQITYVVRRFQSTLPRGERLQFYLKFTLCF